MVSRSFELGTVEMILFGVTLRPALGRKTVGFFPEWLPIEADFGTSECVPENRPV